MACEEVTVKRQLHFAGLLKRDYGLQHTKMSIKKSFQSAVLLQLESISSHEAEVQRYKTPHFQSKNGHYSTHSEILQKTSGKMFSLNVE